MTPTRFETIWMGLFGDYPQSYYTRCHFVVHTVNKRYAGRTLIWNGGSYQVLAAEPERLKIVRLAAPYIDRADKMREGNKKKEPFYVSLNGYELMQKGSMLCLTPRVAKTEVPCVHFG